MEQYNSPSMIKKLKRRKIIHTYQESKKRTVTPKHSAKHSIPSHVLEPELPAITEKKKDTYDWVNDVVGENRLVRTLVDVAGIAPDEFKKIVNRLPSDDIDYLNSPLAVRLLRKLIPCKQEDSSTCEQIDDSTNNLNDKSNAMEDELHQDTLNSATISDTPKASLTCSNPEISDGSQESISTQTQRKVIKSKRKLFRIGKDDGIDFDCSSNNVETNSVLENPHKDSVHIKMKENVSAHKKYKSLRNVINQTIVQKNESSHEFSKDISLPSGLSGNFTPTVRRSRRSSIDFISFTRRNVQEPSIGNRGIVHTLISASDQEILVAIVNKLGGFVIEKNVTDQTSHVVTSDTRRTVKMLKGMSRGCWIVSFEWILKSLEAEKWLDEDEFEMTSFSPAVQKFRLERLSFGSLFHPDIFNLCGLIYVSSKCNPSSADVVELIVLCGGQVIRPVRKAKIVVGETRADKISVSVLWVLDSVTHYLCQPLENYILES